VGQEGSRSFLKKRIKKLLSVWHAPVPGARAPLRKSFLVLFFKKEPLSLIAAV